MSLDVWVRQDADTLVRYRCFEVLPEGKYCVQSKDFYQRPVSELTRIRLDYQFLDQLLDGPPEANGLFDSIQEAIRAHEEASGFGGRILDQGHEPS